MLTHVVGCSRVGAVFCCALVSIGVFVCGDVCCACYVCGCYCLFVLLVAFFVVACSGGVGCVLFAVVGCCRLLCLFAV